MRRLRERNVAILFVSHFLDQVYEISDTMTILRNGKLEGEYPVKALDKKQLIEKMLGRELAELDSISRAAARKIDRTGEPIVKVLALGRKGAVEPIDLEVFDGEVLGLAGLLG